MEDSKLEKNNREMRKDLEENMWHTGGRQTTHYEYADTVLTTVRYTVILKKKPEKQRFIKAKTGNLLLRSLF